MQPFMDENFLLPTDTSRILYHDAAKEMPLIDYHCHLSPREIAQNIRFDTVTQLMLGGDHYKWRQMLTMGVPERLIRGDGDDFEKFEAYARTLRRAIGNPLYHWTHLELKRVFGIDTPLNEDTARDIYDRCNEMLRGDDFRAQALIDRFHVETLCTTDDPVDDLSFHRSIAQQNTLHCRVLPAFRPDKAVNVDRAGFAEYIAKLENAAQIKIKCTEDVIAALERRVDYFHACGARVSDHALDTVPFPINPIGTCYLNLKGKQSWLSRPTPLRPTKSSTSVTAPSWACCICRTRTPKQRSKPAARRLVKWNGRKASRARAVTQLLLWPVLN